MLQVASFVLHSTPRYKLEFVSERAGEMAISPPPYFTNWVGGASGRGVGGVVSKNMLIFEPGILELVIFDM